MARRHQIYDTEADPLNTGPLESDPTIEGQEAESTPFRVRRCPLRPERGLAFQEFMAGPGRAMIYRDVFKIIGQGNFVMAYSHVFLGEELAVFDLFRVEDGRIVEHWDNMEPLPVGPQPNSGKF